MADEEIEIVLVRKTIPIKIGDRKYTLQEMDGVDLGKWRAEMSGRAKHNPAGVVVGLTSYTGVEAALISKCLLDDKGEPVSKDIITNWPVSAQMKLIKLCEEINGLTEETAEKEKNG